MAIKKITEREYLKRLNTMTLQERREYMSRVGEWLRNDRPMLALRSIDMYARLQSVIQLSGGWTEREQQAFHKGARLLTALMGLTDTWLPEQLYMKSAKRSIYRMAECLVGVSVGALPNGGPTPNRPTSSPSLRGRGEVTPDGSGASTTTAIQAAKPHGTQPQAGTLHAGKPSQRMAAGAEKDALLPDKKQQPQNHETAQVTTPLPRREGQGGGSAGGGSAGGGSALVPARPKHIDQYAHLLPKATQERAAKVRELLRELDTARENARKLMEAGEQGDKIAAWAKRATTLDNTVGKIYRELDAEWEKLVKRGRVGVDAFGNAYVVEMTNDELRMKNEADGERGKPELTTEQEKRLVALRAFLREKRIPKKPEKREEHIRKWKEYYRELVRDFGTQYVTESACAIAETMGIELEGVTNDE